MPHRTPRRLSLVLGGALLLSACAGLSGGPGLNVNVVGLESLPGEGMEVRLLVKLRVQNPSEQAIDYDGIALELDLRGLPFATGVSAHSGSLPRFGETTIAVPVSISATALVRQMLSLVNDGSASRVKLDYAARGRLAGGFLGGHRFDSRGALDWPPAPAAPAAPRPSPG